MATGSFNQRRYGRGTIVEADLSWMAVVDQRGRLLEAGMFMRPEQIATWLRASGVYRGYGATKDEAVANALAWMEDRR